MEKEYVMIQMIKLYIMDNGLMINSKEMENIFMKMMNII